MNNVVVLPEDEGTGSGSGKVTYFSADEKTGSGTVTIDMDGVYQRSPAKKGGKDAAKGGPGEDGGKEPEPPIRGLRAMAVDFSGQGGVPALFVVVDKIAGGKRKEWVYHIPEGSKNPKGPVEFAAKGQEFTVKAGDCSLRASFVSPAEPQVEFRQRLAQRRLVLSSVE
jgi:hypothetical protein